MGLGKQQFCKAFSRLRLEVAEPPSNNPDCAGLVPAQTSRGRAPGRETKLLCATGASRPAVAGSAGGHGGGLEEGVEEVVAADEEELEVAPLLGVRDAQRVEALLLALELEEELALL